MNKKSRMGVMRGKFILGTKVRRQNGKFIFIFYFPLVKRKYLWHLKKMKSMGKGQIHTKRKSEREKWIMVQRADRDSIARFLFYLLMILGKVKEWIFEGNCAIYPLFFCLRPSNPFKEGWAQFGGLRGGLSPLLATITIVKYI